MKIINKILCAALALIPAGAFADAHLKNCLYDYKSNVLDLSADGIEEVFKDGRAVVPSVLDLKPGDYFIDEDGIIQIVNSITVSSDGNVVIDSSMPTNLRGFMNMVSIPKQDLDFETSDWVIMGSDAELEPAEDRAAANSSANLLGKAIPERDMTPSLQVTLPIGKPNQVSGLIKALGSSEEDVKKTDDIVKNTSGGSLILRTEVPYKSKSFRITPSVDLPYAGVGLITKNPFSKKFYTKENYYHKGSASLDADINIYTGIDFQIAVKGQFSAKITIAETPWPGIQGGLYFYPEATIMASADFQKYVHFNYAFSSHCDLDGELLLCVPHNFSSNVSRNEIHSGSAINGSIVGTLGIFIGPEISIGVNGFNVASLGAKVGPEAKLTLPLFSYTSYEDSTNEFNFTSPVYSTSYGADALKKTTFQIYSKASVSASFIKGLISIDLWSWKSSPFINLPDDFSKFTTN